MHALTGQQARRSFVNCSRGEAKGLALPRGFADLDRASLELVGWRGPKAPLRGYLVIDAGQRPVGVAVRAADTRMSSRTAAMCLLCGTAQTGDAVSLFTAKRTGAAGRNGNTVGHCVYADLGCADRVRTEIPRWLRDRNPADVVAERAAELRERGQASSRRSAADVWERPVAGHLMAHDRNRLPPAALRPRPRLQPQGLAGAVQQ